MSTDAANTETYVSTFEQLRQEEAAHVEQRRRHSGLPADGPKSGLALSGGGIRSAAFSLGVVRALHERDVFNQLDYMSTVSGGGFVGAFISWFRRRGHKFAEPGRIAPTAALRFLRQNADYLNPAPRRRRGSRDQNGASGSEHEGPIAASLLGMTLGQTFLSMSVYGSLLIGLFYLLHIGDSIVDLLEPVLLLLSRADTWFYFVESLNTGFVIALVAAALGAFRVAYRSSAHTLHSLLRNVVPRGGRPAWSSTWQGALWLVLGVVATGLAVAAVFEAGDSLWAVVAAPLFGSLGLFSFQACRRRWSEPAISARRPGWGWYLIPVTAALLVCAILTAGLAYYLLYSGQAPAGVRTQLSPSGMFWVVVFAGVWSGYFTWRSIRDLSRRFRNQVDPAQGRRQYLRDLEAQRVSGRTLVWATVGLVLGSVPWCSQLLESAFQSTIGPVWTLGALLAVALLWLALRVQRSARGATAHRVRSSWRPLALAGVTAYAMLLLCYGVTMNLVHSAFPHAVPVIAIGGLLLGTLASLNFTGPRRFFRDRLSEAFLPDALAIRENRWLPALEASEFTLASLSDPQSRGPYHLLNASLTTSGSETSKYRHRGADSFILSPLYCGSESTGWMRTQLWQRGRLTLRDAVGISAAAVAPGTGTEGHGPERNRVVAAMLAFFNLRLGYWADNPNPHHCRRPSRLPPNLLRPGLQRGLLRVGVSETARHVELTDGGHFDALGVYELLRRELDLVIVSDASQDPQLAFTALGMVLERAREDLGVEVEFEPGAFDTARPGEPIPSGVAATGFTVGKIRYAHTNRKATLLYLKPVLVRDLDLSVQSFARANDAFPNDPTTNQSFDEDHFCAYEQLGWRIGLDGVDRLTERSEHHRSVSGFAPAHAEPSTRVDAG